jgi:hypothetical protein
VSSLSLFLFAHQYILLVRNANDKILAIHHELFGDRASLKYLLKADILLNMDVPAKVYVHFEKFNLIPSVLYDSSFDSSYLLFAGEGQENQQSFHSSFENPNLILLGCIDQELFDLVSENKKEIHFHHGACSFLSYLLKEKSKFRDQEILVVIYDEFCYLAAFTNQELSLINRFELNNKEDLLEYISGIAHQLQFDPKLYGVSLFGETENLAISNSWGEMYFWDFKIQNPNPNQNYKEGLHNFNASTLFEYYFEFK